MSGSGSLFLKIESNTGVSCGYCKIFKNSFLIEHVAASDSPTMNSKVSWCVCFLISRLHVLWILIKTLRKRCRSNSLLSRDKKLLPCLNCLINCFWFQNIFVKTLVAFDFDKKTYTKRCTRNYVISKDFLPLHLITCGSISEHDLENGRMPCKQKY